MILGKNIIVGSPKCVGADNLYQASYRAYPGEYDYAFADGNATVRYTGELPEGEVRTDAVSIYAKEGLIGVYDRAKYPCGPADSVFTFRSDSVFVDTEISYIKDGKVFQIRFLLRNGDSSL